jgi:hypothetical protein
MATLDIPDDINLPLPENDREIVLFNTLKEYFLKIRQTLSEIESKLP